MNLSRIPFALALLLIAITACKGDQRVEVVREDIHFFVAGNVLGNPDVEGTPFHPPFDQFLEIAKQDSSLDFAIFSGNVTPDGSLNSWEKANINIKKFGKEVYLIPGETDLSKRAIYTSIHGTPNHSFERGNNLFLFWDATEHHWNFFPQQVDDLVEKVESASYDNVFIIVNHMLWYDSTITKHTIPNSTVGRNETQFQTFYHTILSKLNKLNAPVYLFAGDVGLKGGNCGIHRYDNVRMIATGLGGYEWESVIDVSVTNGKASVSANYLDQELPSTLLDTLYNPFLLN